MNDTPEMKLFGSDHRESFLQVKPHLVTENRDGSGTGSIVLLRSLVKDMLQQIVVLFHARNLIIT
jgi:hypothetical protein